MNNKEQSKTQEKKPMAYMLVGVPGSGKSTWLESFLPRVPDAHIISTDNYIESMATMMGTTYGNIFKDYINEANKNLEVMLKEALAATQTVLWDQTNLNIKTRRPKLNRLLNAGYDVTAVAFECPAYELRRRRIEREEKTGKFIPMSILESMTATYTRPTRLEGFREVIIVTPEGESSLNE